MLCVDCAVLVETFCSHLLYSHGHTSISWSQKQNNRWGCGRELMSLWTPKNVVWKWQRKRSRREERVCSGGRGVTEKNMCAQVAFTPVKNLYS